MIKKSKQEQIEAIFSTDVFHWAIEQLPSGEDIDDKHYSDFIDVTAEEIEAYVIGHGFPGNTVKVVTKDQGVFAEDQICIVEAPPGWEVFYIERGKRSDQLLWWSLEEARRDVIQRMITLAKIELNHRYCLAHPELNLPKPSEME